MPVDVVNLLAILALLVPVFLALLFALRWLLGDSLKRLAVGPQGIEVELHQPALVPPPKQDAPAAQAVPATSTPAGPVEHYTRFLLDLREACQDGDVLVYNECSH